MPLIYQPKQQAAEYAYCTHCGAEFFDQKLAYVATYGDFDYYRCPECGAEIAGQKRKDDEDVK